MLIEFLTLPKMLSPHPLNLVQSISRRTILKSHGAVHVEARKEKWDLKLEELKVQTKCSDACSLEKEIGYGTKFKDNL